MTRIVVTAAMITLLTVVVGCQTNTGISQRLERRDINPPTTIPIEVAAAADEVDLAEQLSSQRQAYRATLEKLARYYEVSGNSQKLGWAQTELRALDRIPQYRYVAGPDFLPADLRPTERLQACDDLYAQARETERKAGMLPVFKDEELLRAALSQYNELLKKYPSCDKIDDAAYRMAGIHERFKDYTIALQYYQRTYQWDPATPHPARFKAAQILDFRLHRRAEALQLYQEAIVKESQYTEFKASAERRIQDLSDSDK